MMKSQSLGVLLLILLFIGCGQQSKVDSSFRFTQLSSTQTGITFVNELNPDVSTKANLFDFDYFYNGGGVAAGDINNDGLPDLFFTANQGENHLYINKGDWTYDNITDLSGINESKNWSNGVTTVDINEDGKLDFYISQGGPHDRDQRANLLYVNNGDMTFTERAQEYGLDDKGISTQSAFFDYDNDGDLDCIVINESLYYGYDPITFHRLLLEKPDKHYESFTHLYERRGDTYVDVTRDAGILKPTFGLGIAIDDINEDGYLDFYIANDYFLPDNLYINKKDGTFSDRISTHLRQTSFFGMGVDIADINNDGHQDIYVLDMASQDHYRSKTLMASMDVESFDLLTEKFGFVHQYMFNSLQLNNQMGRFDNIAHMSGVSKTDWSWAALIDDVDLDGYKDIFVSNGYRKYALDNDFKNEVTNAKVEYKGRVPLDVKKSLYEKMPTEPLPNLLFKNDGQLKFIDIAQDIGLDQATYSNGAVLADMDADGDLDLIINNIDQSASIYKNNASDSRNYVKLKFENPKEALTARVELTIGDQIQMVTPKVTRGYRSTTLPEVIFGIGSATRIDECKIRWLDGTEEILPDVKINSTIKVQKSPSASVRKKNVERSFLKPASPLALGLNYNHVENDFNDFEKEVLLPQKQSTLGPCIATKDINDDGIDDLYIGGAHGQPGELYISNGATFRLQSIPAFIKDQEYEDVSATFFDVDTDGDQDLYLASGGNEWPAKHHLYEDRIYINDGAGSFVRSSSHKGLSTYSAGVVKTLDYDNDRDDDILLGNRIVPQSYPVGAPSFLYENDGGTLVDVTDEKLTFFSEAEIINDLEVLDVNQDGAKDIVAVGEWTGIHILYNQDGVYKQSDDRDLLELKGWWQSIIKTDINNDGVSELIIGNIGENIKHKVSKQKPLRVYAEDFDNTGTLDVVLSSIYGSKEVPVRGKECSTEQMPYISEKFQTYDDFASASLIDIYGSDKINKAYQKELNYLSSVLLRLEDAGDIKVEKLPPLAQKSPILDGVSIDVNGDGFEDVLCTGNIYNTEVETPRLDAGSGLVLMSDGENLQIGKCPQECFYISGNVKKMILLKANEKTLVISGVNNAPLNVLEL